MNKQCLILCALLVPAVGWCDVDSIRGFYAGGGIAFGNVFANRDSGLYGSSERGDSDAGYIITGGYRINRYFALEANYVDGGRSRFQAIIVPSDDALDIYGVDIVQRTEAYEGSLVGIFPFAKIWELWVKAGLAAWDARSDQQIAPLGQASIERQIERDGVDFLVGLGFGFSIQRHAHFRFGYHAFRTHDELLALTDEREARFDSYEIEFHWRFGDRW